VSKAGQADAVGGVFRVVAATYLAVHALRDQPVAGLELPNELHTVRLDFETDDPTDDLMATMSDGRRCFISAKREVGNDRHLKDTVEGRVGQMGDIRDGDLLVLAAEELKGVVKDLAEALRRRRDGRDPAGQSSVSIKYVIRSRHVSAPGVRRGAFGALAGVRTAVGVEVGQALMRWRRRNDAIAVAACGAWVSAREWSALGIITCSACGSQARMSWRTCANHGPLAVPPR
jgi:hypothetical protein